MERNAVWMDGDRYYLTVPRESSLERMVDSENVLDKKVIENYLKSSFAIVTYRRDIRPFFGANNYLPFDPEGQPVGQPDPHPNDRVIYFQPCLVPMTKEGEIDDRFVKEMPNGSVVEGGSFLVDGGEFAGVPSCITMPPDKIVISDTGSRPIRWLWFEGMLFSLNAGTYMRARDLYEWLLKEGS